MHGQQLIQQLVLGWGVLSCLLMTLPPGVTSRKRTEPGARRAVNPVQGCGHCDLSQCDTVTSTPCPANRWVRDDCGCCLVCAGPLHSVRLEGDGVDDPSSREVNTPRPGKQLHPSKLGKQLAQLGMSDQPAVQVQGDITDGPMSAQATNNRNELCKNIECHKQQFCMLNIQNLPVCRCPSRFYCRRSQPRRSVVCGDDGVTYHNECVLKATACAEEKRIRVEHQGACKTAQTQPHAMHAQPEKDSEVNENHGAGKKNNRKDRVQNKRVKQRKRKQARKEKKKVKRREHKGKQRRIKDRRNRQRRMRRSRQILELAKSKVVE